MIGAFHVTDVNRMRKVSALCVVAALTGTIWITPTRLSVNVVAIKVAVQTEIVSTIRVFYPFDGIRLVGQYRHQQQSDTQHHFLV